MFDNLLHQSAAAVLARDIANASLPGALLFSGPDLSGKLTAALETARALSCEAADKGAWNCPCPSCERARALTAQSVALAGGRDCSLEISAASFAFNTAMMNGSSHASALRRLYIRAVRKLTMRFSATLMEGDDKLPKIASAISEIEELMETIDFPREIDDVEKASGTCGKVNELCAKLEAQFMPDTIPIRQVRNISSWARIKSGSGKKTIIIEGADRMQEGARNALLKILEEPPADAVFILTARSRQSVMPTILSRARTYSFSERSASEQTDVIRRVFHDETFQGGLKDYMEKFLPVDPKEIRASARDFIGETLAGKIPDAQRAAKVCASFKPRRILRVFLEEAAKAINERALTSEAADAAKDCMKAARECLANVTVFNQGAPAALEALARDISRANVSHGRAMEARA